MEKALKEKSEQEDADEFLLALWEKLGFGENEEGAAEKTAASS
jgi:hypothetical protein